MVQANPSSTQRTRDARHGRSKATTRAAEIRNEEPRQPSGQGFAQAQGLAQARTGSPRGLALASSATVGPHHPIASVMPSALHSTGLVRSCHPHTPPQVASSTARDDKIRRALTDANPWWRAAAARSDPAAWTRDHRLLRDRASHDPGFRPQVLNDVAAGPLTDQLAVLTGPRRIGKSVALLDTAAALGTRTDVDPRQVIHLPCDGMRDRDLRRSLTLGRGLTRSVDTDGPRRRAANTAARAGRYRPGRRLSR